MVENGGNFQESDGFDVRTNIYFSRWGKDTDLGENEMLQDGEKGVIIQRDKKTYAVAPHIPCGVVAPETLRKLADVAERYGAQALKVTSASQGARNCSSAASCAVSSDGSRRKNWAKRKCSPSKRPAPIKKE